MTLSPDLAPVVPAPPAAADLVAEFLAGRSPATLRVYAQALEDFRAHLDVATVADAARAVLTAGPAGGNRLAHGWRAAMLERGLAPATVNVRLAALRSLVRLGRMLGACTWTLDVPGVRGGARRERRAPTTGNVARLLAAAADQVDAVKAARDVALLHLLADLGLRRGEAVSLDVADVDLRAGTIAVRRKGRAGVADATLPGPTLRAVAAWIELRGDDAGPLFVALDRAHRGHRLSGTAVHQLVRELGERVGLRVQPHDLRRAAVTTLLDETDGDVRMAQALAHHASPTTTMRYDTTRRDLAGEGARIVADAIERRQVRIA